MLLNVGLALLLGGLQDPPQPVTPGPELPTALVAYYRDYNFLNAFSTRAERRLLASRRIERDDTEPRLRALRDCMERLSRRVLAIDPGFVRTSRPSAPFAERADLVEIRSQRVDESAGSATVELDVITLVPQANAYLIAQFDQLGRENEPMTAERLLSRVSQPMIVGREVHEWVRVDGAWMREGPTRTFILR